MRNSEIGDQVRVKRRGDGGTAIDRVCNIMGYRKDPQQRQAPDGRVQP
jgi:hypothetical protein